jgi:hypothetical protein
MTEGTVVYKVVGLPLWVGLGWTHMMYCTEAREADLKTKPAARLKK